MATSHFTNSWLKLLHFLDDSPPPVKFLTLEDVVSVNPVFILYEQQDQLLVTWLLASMTTPNPYIDGGS